MKILIGLCIFAIVIFIIVKIRQRIVQTDKINADIQEQNNLIIQENECLIKANNQLKSDNNFLTQKYLTLNTQTTEETKKLTEVKTAIKQQDEILKALNSSVNNLREGAEAQAQSVYEARLAALNKTYEEKEQILKDNMAQRSLLLLKQIENEQGKLNDLQEKQLAYIRAQQRAEEMKAQKDYYRLVISDSDLTEISLLRELQKRFIHKEAIDKLIWETYYKTPYDILMAHLFQDSTKICGIYKITNLQNEQSYIGQSVDIKERFRQHIKAALTNGAATNKLYQQMKEFGPENFTFEILETVSKDKLNDREAYWIDFYKTKNYGMNGTKGNL